MRWINLCSAWTGIGVQLRQNTQLARVAAAEQWVQRDFDITTPILENKDLAEAWVKGDSEFASLDAVDRYRLLFFERRAIVFWHHAYQLRQQELMHDAEWQCLKGIIRTVGRRQAVLESWNYFKDNFEGRFQDFINKQFEIAAKRST